MSPEPWLSLSLCVLCCVSLTRRVPARTHSSLYASRVRVRESVVREGWFALEGRGGRVRAVFRVEKLGYVDRSQLR